MKKGFTVIELAIALLVIGIIIALGIKGASLIGAAEIRSDIRKLQRIGTGVAAYYSKYNEFPGQRADGTFTNQQIVADLIHESLVTDDDFVLSLENNRFLHVVGCDIEAATGGNRNFTADLNSSEGICAIVQQTHPENATSEFTTYNLTITFNFACQIEVRLDNRDFDTGDATAQNLMGTSLPDSVFNDCGFTDQWVSNFSYLLY